MGSEQFKTVSAASKLRNGSIAISPSTPPHSAGRIYRNLYDYARDPGRRPGRPCLNDLSDWRVTDDRPERVPVTPEEVDVFEAWFGDVLDELFGTKTR